MIKCPFCGFENEDGALFCEQCKSDLGGVEPVAEAVPFAAPAVPMASPAFEQTIPMATATPVAEATPMGTAEPVYAETVALAQAEPVVATPVAEAVPVAPEPPPVAPPAAPPPPLPVATAPAAPPAVAPAAGIPEGATPRLVVLRGLKLNIEYPLYEGQNFIGRADEKPVDIDLDDQEPPDRVWSSRQHACIIYENGGMTIEDLNSANGTFVNRNRVYPGQKQALKVGDVIQVGTVQMKLKA